MHVVGKGDSRYKANKEDKKGDGNKFDDLEVEYIYIHPTQLFLFGGVEATLKQSNLVVFLFLGGGSAENIPVFLSDFHVLFYIIFKHNHHLIISSLV